MTAPCCPPADLALKEGNKAPSVEVDRYVQATGDGACHLDLAVDGIHCAACIRAIETGLADMPGLDGVRVNFTMRRVGIDWQDGQFDPADVLGKLDQLGYPARPYQMRLAEADATREMKRYIRSLAVAGFAAMNIMLLVGVGVGGQRLGHHAGHPRLLPLVLGADRAAGRGLCRPALL